MQQVRELSPQTRIVALLDESQGDVVVQAFRLGLGAVGICYRTDSPKLLPCCISCVHRGEIGATSAQLKMALDALSEPIPAHLVSALGDGLLTKRESKSSAGWRWDCRTARSPTNSKLASTQ
jgi:DNA-binding NarL/FixJ family response regulator